MVDHMGSRRDSEYHAGARHIATTLFGVLAGRWLGTPRDPYEKVAGLFVMGNVGLVLGMAWDPVFPINKQPWTSSYVVFTTGVALSALACCYWVIDLKGYRRIATPFVVFEGMLSQFTRCPACWTGS